MNATNQNQTWNIKESQCHSCHSLGSWCIPQNIVFLKCSKSNDQNITTTTYTLTDLTLWTV